MRPLLALAFKDMKLLFRDKMGFFFTLIYPLFVAVLFGSMFSGEGSSKPGKICLAVADEDSTAPSRAFI
ncbi:MAG: ABC transporter permease, partial [bacterium]